MTVLKKILIFLTLLIGGYIAYLKLTDKSPPFNIPFFSNEAYTTYQKFATALANRRFEEAKTFAEDQAIAQLAEAQMRYGQIAAMGMQTVIHGISYNKESETISDDGNQVHLQILQVVRVDPPGQTSAFGKPVDHHHEVTLKKTESGWKVVAFSETVGVPKQNLDTNRLSQSESNSRDHASKSKSVIEFYEKDVVPATPQTITREQLAMVSEALQLKAQVDIQSLKSAITQFKEIQGKLPSSLDELVQREVLEQLPEAPSGTQFIYHPENGNIELASIKVSSATTTTDPKPTESTKQTLKIGDFKDILNAAGNTQAAAELKRVRVAINVYFAQEDRYPSSLEDLVRTGLLESVPMLPDGKYFSYDPNTGKVGVVTK